MARDADLDGPLVGWREKGHRVEYLGTEDVDGTPAHKLRVTLKDGDTQYVYLDPDAWLEIRVVTESHVRGVEQVTETDLGAYEQVAGVLIPFSIESGPKGRPRGQRITVERAEPNVEADEASFHIPAKGAAVGRAILAGPAVRAAAAAASRRPCPRTRPSSTPASISGLGARNIGSATMSGRISAVAAAQRGRQDDRSTSARPAAACGSRSTAARPSSRCSTRTRCSRSAPSPSTRATRSTVWVGTGESWTRNSVSVGDGIYRSTDAGETWTNMGLAESERIARIVVHPSNGDVVYACVPGQAVERQRRPRPLQDGRRRQDLDARAQGREPVDRLLEPRHGPEEPEVICSPGCGTSAARAGRSAPAATARTRRAAAGCSAATTAGGAGRRSTPANGSGLPAAPWGRVEVEIAPSDAKIVYAFIESKDSALYRSATAARPGRRATTAR